MLGSNVPTVGGLAVAFSHADRWGCECIQVYVTLSRTWLVADLQPETVAAFKAAWAQSRVKEVVAHVPFLVNLASDDSEARQRSAERLLLELRRADTLGVRNVVLHPGFNRRHDRKESIRYISHALNSVLASAGHCKTTIALETMAGQGGAIGSRFEEIAGIIDGVEKSHTVGVCLDLAHVFIAGYRLRRYEGYEAVIGEFDRVIGLDRIRVIHVSDSRTSLGSRNDRHASIGEGQMGLQVFHALVRDSRFVYTPIILEIPDRDSRSQQDLALLRALQSRTSPLAEPEKPRQLSLEGVS